VHVRSLLVLAALAGCRDKSRDAAPAPGPDQKPDVEVRDGTGNVVAQLRQSRPCRATIGPPQPRSGEEKQARSQIELIVGGPPLVSTLGDTKWEGADEPNGTILIRNGERIARVYPVGQPAAGGVFDLHGVAQARITVAGDVATLENKASVPVRRLTLAGDKITADDPALTITGTNDLVLAALLSAPELLPEVRMLAACQRVLVTKDSKDSK
jgi:hypothetical protein